jgi:hypothetical protein
MRMRHALVLTLVGVVVAACEPRDDADTEPGLLPGDDPADTRGMILSRGEFRPTADAQGLNISGWAELRQDGATLDDGVELRVHLMGLGEGDHAWHIHSGTCEQPGGIVLPLSDHPGAGFGADTRARPGTDATQPGTIEPGTTQPGTTQPGTTTDTRGIASDLSAGSDGMVEETVNIDRDRLMGLNFQSQTYIVNVHQRGGDNPGPAIACAELQPGGGAYGTQPGMGQPGMTQPGMTQPQQPGTTQPPQQPQSY